jgi:pimeloyl-ACP methyl ester carboxylesterase
MTDAPRIQYAKTSDGVNIAYATAGSGTPLVWIQSPVQSHVQLEWQQPIMRAGYEAAVSSGAKLARFDPGERVSLAATWRTSHPPLSYAISKPLSSQLQLDRFPLLAIESGAATAIAYETLHPEQVSRLVFIESNIRGRLYDPPWEEMVGPG